MRADLGDGVGDEATCQEQPLQDDSELRGLQRSVRPSPATMPRTRGLRVASSTWASKSPPAKLAARVKANPAVPPGPLVGEELEVLVEGLLSEELGGGLARGVKPTHEQAQRANALHEGRGLARGDK